MQWIDSCCIDKSSSAELSEAINSMYRWYSDAQVCYAFLFDVWDTSGQDPHELGSEFRRSKWFTRGWTLQELLAPSTLVFFDRDWKDIGTKSSLKDLLESITGVKEEHLFDCRKASVAQKMSWAAIRETTRVEDQAYCLMGLFQVNMPPLYGEGERAFLRLQSEILRTSDDASIFAWSDKSQLEVEGETSLLAESPAAFLDSGDVVPALSRYFESAYSMTNRGLQIEVPFMLDTGRYESSRRWLGPAQEECLIIVPLACSLDGERLAVHLRRNVGSRHQFHRCPGQTPLSMTELYSRNKVKAGLETRTIYVMQHEHNEASDGPATVIINTKSLLDNGYEIMQRHINEGSKPNWQGLARDSLDLASVQGDTETVWHPYRVTSLLLIFKKGRERISLQIFRNYKRAGLRIVTARHQRHQDEENIFWDHVRPWQNDGDRVIKLLPEGGHASASIKVAAVNLLRDFNVVKGPAKEEWPRLFQSKEPIHMVRFTIDTRAAVGSNYGATTKNRQQQQNSASGPSGNQNHTWTRTVPFRDRVPRDQFEHSSDDERRYYEELNSRR